MFYQIIRRILQPFILILMMIGGRKGEFLKKRLKQDFSSLKKEEYIWVHCSSVGEINLSETLIKKLLENRNERILLTMFTDTGIGVARDKFRKNERVDIFYFPLDDRKNILDILKRIKLNLLILVETEIWPNLITEIGKKSKVIIVNGRISDRSFKRYQKLSSYLKKIFLCVDRFYMQSNEDSRRIIEIGAEKNRVEILGNLKFDISFQKYNDKEKRELQSLFNIDGRKIFTAGSSRSGEYEVLLDTFKELKDTLLVLVPRHIERTPKIEEIIKEYGFSYKKYSEIDSKKEKTDIVIVDKIGILRKIYSITDIAFVGGTLVNIGGHSLLEPLFYGKTPIFGPYLQNVKEISREILELGLGYKVTNVKDFLEAIKEIDVKQESSIEKIKELFEKNSRTADKIVERIKKLI
ncbi:3-deoxy-D-manno-octulosonic-acid transferase [Fusobacterium necrogenes]|uniref:3-deoxy-D-manno-octulosonic acid transferase n=1 Tax=Fusobacterium necrogenes TaxID=858 RepID=A0A377GYB7_9FUSO|nr:glycosyltransferase N-terminal domain-containing protein [Fusobacterium necrogenes]STO31980.1 3-deoxy-D-manno-octulosonic-acid transferase [Fusobacterium necrogenes]